MNTLRFKTGLKTVKFGDVVKNANLTERDPEAAGIERIVGLDHLDPENLHVRRWNTLENGTSFSRKFVPGQTLFGKRRAYQRKVAFAEFEGICSGDILTFEPKDSDVLLPELLPFICQTDAFFDHALGTSAGSLSPRTSWKALQDFEFPLPPIEEQKRIAEILWAADETIESFRRVADNARASRTIAFEGFSRRDTEHRSTLDEALHDIIAGKSPQGASRPAKDHEYGVLKVSAVGNEGYVEGENKALVRQSDFRQEYEVQPGFILVTRANASPTGVGRPCVVEDTRSGLMLSDKTLRLIPNGQLVRERFLVQNLFANLYRRYVETVAGGTEAKNISQARLKEAPIWLPPISVQKKVEKVLRAFDEAIESAEHHVNESVSLLRNFNANWENLPRV